MTPPTSLLPLSTLFLFLLPLPHKACWCWILGCSDQTWKTESTESLPAQNNTTWMSLVIQSLHLMAKQSHSKGISLKIKSVLKEVVNINHWLNFCLFLWRWILFWITQEWSNLQKTNILHEVTSTYINNQPHCKMKTSSITVCSDCIVYLYIM